MLSLLPLLSIVALAGDAWSTPHRGVSLLERTTADQHIVAAYVDVCENGIAARATTSAERQQRTSTWARSVGAVVAMNGAFFSYTDYGAIGWSIGDGQTWPNAYDTPHYTAIALASHGRTKIFDPSDALPPLGESWWREMVPGDPLLIDDGRIVSEACYSHMCAANPRSAVGLSADGHTVLMVAVDGRSPGAAGMTRAQLASLMLDLGAWRALNLDGGGSTTLWVDGLGVVNRPSGGSERVVASHLGFLDNAGDPGCCIPQAVPGSTGTFADLPSTHWGFGFAEALYAAGVTSGCQSSPLMFCPDCVLDRAHFAVLLSRAAGLPAGVGNSFADLDPTDWRAPYAEALYDAGITNGCGSSPLIFCPDQTITRYEAAVFTLRGMGLAQVTPSGRFPDLTPAQGAVVEALNDACIVNGYSDGSFGPNDELTRIQAAAILARAFSIGGYGPCTVDPGTDTGTDTSTDTGTASDTSTDPGTDTTTDPGSDSTSDTDPGSASDTDPDTDSASDTDPDTVGDTGIDTGSYDRIGCAGCNQGSSGLSGLSLLLALGLTRRRRRG